MDNLSKYFRDTAAELKQVAWPTREQAMMFTALVVGISSLVALYTGAFDYLFSQMVNVILHSF